MNISEQNGKERKYVGLNLFDSEPAWKQTTWNMEVYFASLQLQYSIMKFLSTCKKLVKMYFHASFR
jgi:hypothetical protein